jgi:hypothetical protein
MYINTPIYLYKYISFCFTGIITIVDIFKNKSGILLHNNHVFYDLMRHNDLFNFATHSVVGCVVRRHADTDNYGCLAWNINILANNNINRFANNNINTLTNDNINILRNVTIKLCHIN